MISKDKIEYRKQGCSVSLSVFYPKGGKREWHVIIHVEQMNDSFTEQQQRLQEAWSLLMQRQELCGAKVIFKRYFLSDIANQGELIMDNDLCTKDMIQQQPLDGSKLALWAYLQEGTEVTYACDTLNSTVVRSNGYEHIWTMGLCNCDGDSYKQTDTLLNSYTGMLNDHEAVIADNCIRTWFFVRDVDSNYKGLVLARKSFFLNHGLTPNTHYIASTGIGGSPMPQGAMVMLSGYAIKGLQQKQQRYLYAPTHMNKTIDYGVTFERGTVVSYGDRCHAFISGTASIDNKGCVVHVGDIRLQTMRMWENVGKLLEEADMSFDNVMQIIVYLRDTADYTIVSKMFAERFPNTPYIITLAPVCRPQWLIEMECIAVSGNGMDGVGNF